MTPELERVETAAWQQQYAGLPPGARALVAPLGPLTVFGVGAWPDSAWHAVVTGLSAPPPLRQLDAALALLDRLGARTPVLPVVEGAVPDDELVARGFRPAGPLLRVVRDLAGPPAAAGSVRVDPVGPEAGAAVASVYLSGVGGTVDQAWWRAGLGRSGWTQVLARGPEAPVGTGALFVEGAEAWVGSATVVPAARREGVHAALLAARLLLAAEQGATRVSARCVPGSAGARALERAGFAVAHRLVLWRRAGR